jgi:hypothetical protein
MPWPDVWRYGSEQRWSLLHTQKIDETYISYTLDNLKIHPFGKVEEDDMRLLYHAIQRYYHVSHIQYIVERMSGGSLIRSDIMEKIRNAIQWKYIRLYYLLEDSSRHPVFYKYYSDQLDSYAAHFGITYKKGAAVLSLLRK